GGSSPTPSIPSASINLSSDLSGEVDVGTEYTFTWTTSNASSCSSSGDWNETVSTSGSHTLTLNEAKAYTFSLSCTNSAGTTSSKSLSITANYLLIGGKIIHSDNSGKTVYIDQNHNRVFDSFEYSGESDSSGNYQIRSMDNIECIKDFPVAVNNTYLYSINPQLNKDEVNISPLTSIFRSLTSSGLYDLPGDFYNSETPCNLPDNYVNSFTLDDFEDEIELQENITLYSYADIQQDPASTSSKAAIDSSRFEDLDSFYISLNQLEDQLVTNVKSLLDEGLSGTGFSSSDYTITSASDINNRNIVIFLNEQNYPASLADTYSPSSIDDIALKSSFDIKIDPKSNVSTSNLNGWDESINISLYRTFITNNSQLMRDNENCHMNFSSYCILDIANDLFGDSVSAYNSVIDYRLLKETSRGIERLLTEESIISDLSICSVRNESMITDTINSSSSDNYYLRDAYVNSDNSISLDYEGDCYSYYPDYKYMYSSKAFQDGTAVFLSWDNIEIDALPNAYNFSDFDVDNLPPDQIENQIIEEFLRRPSLPVGFDNVEFTMTSEYLSSISVSMFDYVITKADLYQDSWIEYFVKNINGGNAYVAFERYNSSFYIMCYQNSNEIFNINFGYNLSAAYYYLYECLQLNDENEDFIFSRSSTHKSDHSGFTVSPYDGLVSMSNFQTSPESESVKPEKGSNAISETEQIKTTQEETMRLKKNRMQSASNLREFKVQQ
ncbi:hypothetical protein N9K97_05095, partial [Gammaproteobacteria bacterium]|nr:hypothetical protein [Gammaproteobacteria bacterium]